MTGEPHVVALANKAVPSPKCDSLVGFDFQGHELAFVERYESGDLPTHLEDRGLRPKRMFENRPGQFP